MPPRYSQVGFAATSKHSGGQRLTHIGATLYLGIGYDPQLFHRKPTPENWRQTGLTLQPALIDTGADLPCLDPALAESLRLPLSERTALLAGLGSPEQPPRICPIHRLQIYLPELDLWIRTEMPAMPLQIGNPFDQEEWGIDFPYHPLILGRSFFEELPLRLEYEGNGQVRLCRADRK